MEIALLESRLKRPKVKKTAQTTAGREVREEEGDGMREKGGEGWRRAFVTTYDLLLFITVIDDIIIT